MAKDKLIYASAARKAILKEDPKLAYCIDNIPGVDAVEVVHGRWDRVKFFANATLHHCSICGHAEIKTYNYCPNCGAKMDGGN